MKITLVCRKLKYLILLQADTARYVIYHLFVEHFQLELEQYRKFSLVLLFCGNTYYTDWNWSKKRRAKKIHAFDKLDSNNDYIKFRDQRCATKDILPFSNCDRRIRVLLCHRNNQSLQSHGWIYIILDAHNGGLTSVPGVWVVSLLLLL